MVSWSTRYSTVSKCVKTATSSISRQFHTSPALAEHLVRLKFDHCDERFIQVGKSVKVGNFIWTPYTTMLNKNYERYIDVHQRIDSNLYFSIIVECKPTDPTLSFECVAGVDIIDHDYYGADRNSYTDQIFNDRETKSTKLGDFYNSRKARELYIHVNVKSFEIFPQKCFTSHKPNLTDIELIVGDKTFYASKHILAQHSRKFYDMIYGGDKSVDRLEIKDVNPEDFLLFLEALYDCEKGVRWSSIEKIANLSILFESSKCFKACEMFLIRQNVGKIDYTLYDGNREKPGVALKYCKQFGFKILLDQLLNTLTEHQIKNIQYEKKFLLGEVIEEALAERLVNLKIEDEKKKMEYESKEVENKIEVNTIQPYLNMIDQDSIDFSHSRDNLTDIVLSVGDKKYHVSKQILANASTFFKKLFYGDSNKKKEHVFELKDVDQDEFEEFLQHVHNPDRNHKITNIDYLIKRCHFFDASYNLRQCQKYILNSDSFNDAQKIYMARKYHLTYLFDQVVFKYQKMDNFKKLTLMKDFDRLDRATVGDITMKVLENHTESDYYYY